MENKSIAELEPENLKIDENNTNDIGLNSKFEQFLLSLSLKFINVNPTKIDNVIENCLEEISNFLNADRGYIYFFEDKKTRLSLIFQYNQKGLKQKIPQHEQVDKDDFSWLTKSIFDKQPVLISSLDELPPKANTIKVIMEVEDTKSMILSPIVVNEDIIGIIGIDTIKEEKPFSENTKILLNRSGPIFAEAIIRRKKEQSAILIEQRFRNLFSKIEDVVFITSPDGKFLDINTAGVNLFGYSSVKELQKLNIAEDLYLNPVDRKEYQRQLNLRGQIKDFEIILKRKDGKKIVVLVTATVVRDEKGDVIAYQGILHDVTKRRHLEQQLFQAQKLESIGLLAGGVSHDFNNILTTISGYAELIRMDIGASHSHYHNINNIINGCKRAGSLIRKLLAFSRRQMIEPKVISINHVITELHSILARLIAEDIRFDLKLEEKVGNLKADPVQIQQILVNLVVNARHAIELNKDKSKKEYINIITDELKLTEEFIAQHPGSRKGRFILIEVQDSGIGMDERTKLKIFEPFFSTKKEGEGSGLGLSIVYGIVKQNNGNIYVESQPGKGTTFKIYWPSTARRKMDDTRIETPIRIKPSTGNILVVEDDFYVREFVGNALKSIGYTVIEAENGEHALRVIKKEELFDKLDLVVTDLVMPEMGGEELAERIHQINPAIKIILCSGYSDTRVTAKDKYDEQGYVFLSKPYTIKKLEKTIHSLLRDS